MRLRIRNREMIGKAASCAELKNMEDASAPVPPDFSNNLRQVREKAGMTRDGLAALCVALAVSDRRYTSLTAQTIRNLETGERRPRMRTAVTLAAILETTREALFPSGIDDSVRNPTGKTLITPDHKSRQKKN
jgi:DNA-binding XRE family transcriptional regulator